MTNREAILKKFGDSLIADQLIEKVNYYKKQYDYRQQGWCIVYKFNGKIYPNIDDAFKALKEWLDEEEETRDEDNDNRTIRIPIPKQEV